MHSPTQPANRLKAVQGVAFLAIWLASCSEAPAPTPVEEILQTRNRVELFAGLEPDAPVQGILDYGTRVTILDTHRSYVRVRTQDEREGWVHRPLLLDYRLQLRLRTLASQTAASPSQGTYRARDTLNVHVEPYRWSPTFYQLAKNESFEVLDRMLVERLPASAANARRLPEPTGLDHWYLVRVPEVGQVGWLIGNMAYADIPLEIAKLGQGRSINAYFALDEIHDESLGTSKTTWLWLQAEATYKTLDFDRLSVFQWDSRRDRYVIILRRTGLTGYLPVETLPELETKHGIGTGFRVLLEEAGELYARTYVYTNGRVYGLGQEAVSGTPRLAPPGGFGNVYKKTLSGGS